jgi:hypothetical protein
MRSRWNKGQMGGQTLRTTALRETPRVSVPHWVRLKELAVFPCPSPLAKGAGGTALATTE